MPLIFYAIPALASIFYAYIAELRGFWINYISARRVYLFFRLSAVAVRSFSMRYAD